MLELNSLKKNKINLADYDYKQDIANRILLSDFSVFDIEVLEEILFSPLKTTVKKLSRNLGCAETELHPTLLKLSQAELLMVQDESVIVDKEKRKYFELQIIRFDADFKPDMEFLQSLLKKVPIHLLPIWYPVPRSSNNIFESLIEKIFLTPHVYQRYLDDLCFQDPAVHVVMEDLFSSPDFKIASSDLIAKYNLTRERFEEITLILEFHFAACLVYEKEDDHWLEFVVPFYPWHEHLRFLKKTESHPISPDLVTRHSESDFFFIEEMEKVLLAIQERPRGSPPPSPLLPRILQKTKLIQLVDQVDGVLQPTDALPFWLNLSLENKALYLYRHTGNRLLSAPSFPERMLREGEKSIRRVLHGEWVFLDDFIKGVNVPLSENSTITLKKTGKLWKYNIPSYDAEEKKGLEALILEWFFEVGIVATGTCQGRSCFKVTSFGQFFFED